MRHFDDFQSKFWQFVSHRIMRLLLMGLAVSLVFLIFSEDAVAGPGGQFVKKALSSKFGRWGALLIGGLLLIAFIIFLPLILYIAWKERRGIKRTQNDLETLAADYPWFRWPVLEKRARKAVKAIYKVWSTADLSSASEYMTAECYSTQQATLKRWVAEGYTIVCRLKNVKKIAPLAVMVENEESFSWVRVLVRLEVMDYLQDTQTREIVQGKDEVDSSFDTVWMFAYLDGEWLLHSIEEGTTSLHWANTANEIETGFLRKSRQPAKTTSPKKKVRRRSSAKQERQPGQSQAPGSQLPKSPPAARRKKSSVRKRKQDEGE